MKIVLSIIAIIVAILGWFLYGMNGEPVKQPAPAPAASAPTPAASAPAPEAPKIEEKKAPEAPASAPKAEDKKPVVLKIKG
jgi:hypothetical protein